MAEKKDRTAGLVNWKPGQSGNPNGRPKKVLTKYIQNGYSKSQVRDTYAAISSLTESEIQKVITDKESTVLEISIAKAFMKATKSGDYRLIKDVVELFADKSNQHIEHNINYIEFEKGDNEEVKKYGKSITLDE